MGNSFRIRRLRHCFTDEDQEFGRKGALTFLQQKILMLLYL